jgi:hypothetical protein
MIENQSAIACRLEALTETQHHREQELLQFIRKARLEGKETATGYAIRFPSDSSVVLQVAEFITLERLCCPFLGFELQVEAEAGPIWLRLSGREGVKEFLAGLFSRQA